jgi:hypothetical protein
MKIKYFYRKIIDIHDTNEKWKQFKSIQQLK